MAKKVEADEKTNTFEPDRVEKIVRKIEGEHDALLSERMSYMGRCRPYRERINQHYEEGAALGIPKKILKAKIRERDLRRKIDGIADDFEDDDRETFEQVSQALGDYADLPLGKAAVEAAAKTEKPARGRGRKAPSPKDASSDLVGDSEDSDDGEPDLRSDAQKLAERDREEESARIAAENAGKLADGIKPLTH